MNKLFNTRTLNLLSLSFCVFIFIFTKPNIEKPLTILIFFTIFFIFLYLSSLNLLKYLGGQNHVRLYAFFISSPIFLIQILATFRSLRTVELLLIVITSFAVGLYVSRRKT